MRPEKTSGRGSEGLISHRPLQVTTQNHFTEEETEAKQGDAHGDVTCR